MFRYSLPRNAHPLTSPHFRPKPHHTPPTDYNYFNLDNFVFQQVSGTAMGAIFSPTIANIFMSTILRKFLTTQAIAPLLLTRYIDDIFIIWPDTIPKLTKFLDDLNTFHPKLHFTYQYSTSTIDFLDLTIFKGTAFHFVNILDTKSIQKAHNLYQYLHFTSSHPQNVFTLKENVFVLCALTPPRKHMQQWFLP